jgi:hypothetical protein
MLKLQLQIGARNSGQAQVAAHLDVAVDIIARPRSNPRTGVPEHGH